MEDVVLVLNKCDSKDVEDAFRTWKGLATESVLWESFDQMVADLCIDEVLLFPLQVNKRLLRGQVEVEQTFNELGALQGVESSCTDKITLTEL